MDRAEKAALRLAIGLGLAVLAAYGLGLTAPFVVCVMAVLVLCKPGPPIPLLQGAVLAGVIVALMAAGLLMVPILENYAVTGVVLTGALLYALFRSANPLTTILVMSVTLIPVAGVADQALVPMLGVTLAVGLFTGILISRASHAFFPDAPVLAKNAPAPATLGPEATRWIALRATLVVMPMFVLALTNPSFYLPAILKSAALGQQAASTNAGSAGRELVGSTLQGAGMAAVVWFGLSLWPNLWMLTLWMAAAALWAGARLFGTKATSFPPSFWSNALVTMLILLGPAIEDSANGEDVLTASATRVALFIGVAIYAWVTVWAFERWRASRSKALFFERGSTKGETPC